MTNSVDHDQTPHSVASDLGQYCLGLSVTVLGIKPVPCYTDRIKWFENKNKIKAYNWSVIDITGRAFV